MDVLKRVSSALWTSPALAWRESSGGKQKAIEIRFTLESLVEAASSRLAYANSPKTASLLTIILSFYAVPSINQSTKSTNQSILLSNTKLECRFSAQDHRSEASPHASRCCFRRFCCCWQLLPGCTFVPPLCSPTICSRNASACACVRAHGPPEAVMLRLMPPFTWEPCQSEYIS